MEQPKKSYVVHVEGEEITIEPIPILRNSFFDALGETPMIKEIDLEAYFVYRLVSSNLEEIKDLYDKYLIPIGALSGLATDITMDKEDLGIKNLRLLTETWSFGAIERLINEASWKNYIKTPAALEGKIDLNVRDKDGYTALIYACINGLSDIALKLIETGKCDYNLQNKDGRTALMIACWDNRSAIAMKLIETGKCDYNLQDYTGWTALMFACRYAPGIALKLIETRKCDYNIQDNEGWTALMFACRYNVKAVAMKLIETGKCDYNLQNKYGRTALMFACRYAPDIALKLIETGKCDYNIQDNEGWTALMFARANDLNRVARILESEIR